VKKKLREGKEAMVVSHVSKAIKLMNVLNNLHFHLYNAKISNPRVNLINSKKLNFKNHKLNKLWKSLVYKIKVRKRN
jgi:hypothetical protein